MVKKTASRANTSDAVPLPESEQHHRDQHGVDQHRAGDGDAIGRGKVGRGAEGQHQQDDHDHQRPVDDRDVDLAGGRLAGVGDPEARHEAQLDGLLRHREGAGNDRLAGDDRRHGRQQHERQAEGFRGQIEERVLDGCQRLDVRLRQQHRPLAHVVEDQRRQDEIEPAELDRAAAEMAHVRVERFGAGHRQHDRAHGDEGRPWLQPDRSASRSAD